MKNINSGSENFEGKKTFNHITHFSLSKLKINYRKRRRRVTYLGVINSEPAKVVSPVLPFKTGSNY